MAAVWYHALVHRRLASRRPIDPDKHLVGQQPTPQSEGQHPSWRARIKRLGPTFKGGYKLEVNFGEKCQE